MKERWIDEQRKYYVGLKIDEIKKGNGKIGRIENKSSKPGLFFTVISIRVRRFFCGNTL